MNSNSAEIICRFRRQLIADGVDIEDDGVIYANNKDETNLTSIFDMDSSEADNFLRKKDKITLWTMSIIEDNIYIAYTDNEDKTVMTSIFDTDGSEADIFLRKKEKMTLWTMMTSEIMYTSPMLTTK